MRGPPYATRHCVRRLLGVSRHLRTLYRIPDLRRATRDFVFTCFLDVSSG
jgi:hypothetical protein